MMGDDFGMRTATIFIGREGIDSAEKFIGNMGLFEDSGISVRTTRAVLGYSQFKEKEIEEISKNLEDIGFWGYCVSFDDPLDESQIELAKHIVLKTKNGFANFALSGANESLDSNYISPCVNLIKDISKVDGGIENFKLGFSFGLDSETPFFPYSKNHSREGFSVGLEYVNLLKKIIIENDRKPMDEIRESIIYGMNNMLKSVSKACKAVEKKSGLEFLGFDLSLAPYPYPLEDQSIVDLIEVLGNKGRSRGDREFRFGMSGTMFLHTFLTSTIKEIIGSGNWPTTGFNGVMYSLLEDTGLSKRYSDGSLGVNDLLLTSTTCGVGIDMVPITGRTSRKTIASIFFDVYSISISLNKPLGIRILPIPDSRPGDPTRFRHLFFANTVLKDIGEGISFNELPAQKEDDSTIMLWKRGVENF